jgi:hypothetical protein
VGTEALVQDLDNRDQREIDRRELEEERISQLTGQDKQDAEIAEAERQRSYNEQRSQLRNPQTRHI